MSKQTKTTGGIGFFGLLAIVFIALKLIGVIDWSWLWVLAPLWVGPAIVVAILILGVIFCLFIMLVEEAVEFTARRKGKSTK